MSDIHALSGAYAIDALDDLERARFERHLTDCSDCRAEVDSLRAAAALLPETTMTAPPPGLRDRVLADIATVRPLPPLTVEVPQRRRFRGARPAALVAAAAVVAALGAGVAVVQPWQDDTSQAPRLTAVDRVLQADDAQSFTAELPGGGTATVTRSEELNQAVLEADGLADLPGDRVYEMWLDHADVGMVPAGLMENAKGPFLMEGDAALAQGAGITIEPAGGSEEPTLPAVTTISFEQA